jgi:hypothetical protein
MRRLLEYQADQIEMVLYSHKVPGRVLGGVVTPPVLAQSAGAGAGRGGDTALGAV